MKKKLIVFMSVLVFSFALSGCGSQIELSDENSELIAQYAAGILLKYDKNYNEGLFDTLSLENESNELENIETLDELAQNEDTKTIDETSQNGNTEILQVDKELENTDNLEKDANPQSSKSLNEGVNVKGLDFAYINYEFAEYYPNNGAYENMDYVVNPKPGNQLFILNFTVKNTGSEMQKLDLFSLNPEFYAVLNNETRLKAIKTVLLNDLSTITVEIESEDTLEAVLLYEVPLDFEKEISSINLEINMNDVATNVVLK